MKINKQNNEQVKIKLKQFSSLFSSIITFKEQVR